MAQPPRSFDQRSVYGGIPTGKASVHSDLHGGRILLQMKDMADLPGHRELIECRIKGEENNGGRRENI